MKYLRTILSMLCALSLALPVHAEQRNLKVAHDNSLHQKRVALVIGNAKYQGVAELRNPVHDANAISGALNRLGFEVIEVTDATQREMNLAIARFGQKLNGDTAALFFYAGHGLQVRGKNYIVPVDAQINSEAEVVAVTVDMDAVMAQLNAAPVSIVILDACRNNPFERRFRALGGGLAQMDAPKGSFIAYATAPGKTAADGDGQNGLFTQELLKQINTPGLTLEQVFKRVRANVSRATADAQMPWDSSSMTGDFYFKPGDKAQMASLEPVPVHLRSKAEIERDTWFVARDSRNEAGIREYMKQYPQGRYMTEAKVLLATLQAEAKPAEPPPVTVPTVNMDAETALWTEAQKGNTKEDYQAYLDAYPKGKYRTLAQSRIDKREEEARATAVRRERQAWNLATQENSVESYGRYLAGYPQGSYAGLAKVRQEKLKSDLAAREEAELWKKAERSNSRQALEAYLNKYPVGRYAAAASEKLQAIREEEAKGPEMVEIPGRRLAIGKYPVTRGEFAKFVQETGYDMGDSCAIPGAYKGRSGRNWQNPGFTQDDTHPVVCVSWNDAQAYVRWLSGKTGLHYKLPTESEWEAACYAGNKTKYCGGNNLDAVAWYYDNSGEKTHPVGQKQANGYGLYDMSGNVWEWMENHYDAERYVFRGGSWYHATRNMRASERTFRAAPPHVRSNDIGFRLERVLPYVAAANKEPQATRSDEAQGPAMVAIPGKHVEMGKYEVTQKEWREVMGYNPSYFNKCGDNCPVEQVSWDDIQEFLRKLNAKTGKQYRLPTEDEWEAACYAGNRTEYCGSNDIDAVAWYDGNSGGWLSKKPHPVGQKQPNGYGLYDMSGNVYEWMENKYDGGHAWRALRGGSCTDGSQHVQAAHRASASPDFSAYYNGFRLARTLP